MYHRCNVSLFCFCFVFVNTRTFLHVRKPSKQTVWQQVLIILLSVLHRNLTQGKHWWPTTTTSRLTTLWCKSCLTHLHIYRFTIFSSNVSLKFLCSHQSQRWMRRNAGKQRTVRRAHQGKSPTIGHILFQPVRMTQVSLLFHYQEEWFRWETEIQVEGPLLCRVKKLLLCDRRRQEGGCDGKICSYIIVFREV